jgi:hypothetical protein
VIAGTASGTLGGSSFTDALVEVTVQSDTDNVAPEPFGVGCTFCWVNIGETTVEIAGIGTATVTDPAGIWGFAQPVDVSGTGGPELPTVVIGTVDNPPLTDSFTGLAGVLSASLLGYELKTAIGPITGLGGVGYPPRLFVNTTMGALSFTRNFGDNIEDGIAGGTFTAIVAVPEPASLLLLASGVAALAAEIRRRRRT